MESEPFCIILKEVRKTVRTCSKAALLNTVVYPQKQQKGKSFIDYVSCGIGLELGLHKKRLSKMDTTRFFQFYLNLIC
jgi:hypothetical protein